MSIEDTLNPTAPQEESAVESTTEPVEEPTEPTTEPTGTEPTTEEGGVAIASDEGAGEDAEGAAAAPFISVKSHHQQHDLTQEEAVEKIKKGYKWESHLPVYNELTMLAEESGYGSASEFVRALMQSRENVELQRLINELGEGKEALAKEILEKRRTERGAKFKTVEQREREAAEAEQATREQTLAAQFTELQEEFPEYTSLDKVPKAVRTLAERKDISLLDAALRYQRSENRRIQAEEKKQQEAAKASTGSLKSEPERKDNIADSFSAAFRGTLGL